MGEVAEQDIRKLITHGGVFENEQAARFRASQRTFMPQQNNPTAQSMGAQMRPAL
jgi:hypothetical protein